MRTVNVPLLVGLLLGVSGLGVGVYFLHAYQVRRNADVFLEQAHKNRDAFEKSDAKLDDKTRDQKVADISRQYDNYLVLRPTDVDAMLAKGEFLLGQKRYFPALSTFEAVLLLKPTLSDLRRRVADLSLDLGQRVLMHPDPNERIRGSTQFFTNANRHLVALLKERPNDADLLEEHGRCLLYLGKENDAAEAWRRAIAAEADPPQIDAHTRLANLLRFKMERPSEADELMNKLARDNPDLHAAQLAMANYLIEINELDKAEPFVNRALELKDDDRATLMLAVRYASTRHMQAGQQRDEDEAKKQLELARARTAKLRELFPKDADVYLISAEVEGRAGNMTAAADMFREGLGATSDNAMLVWHAVNLLIDLNVRDEAKDVFERSGGANLPEGMKGFLVGRMKMADEKWREAIDQFERARPQLAGNPMYLKQLDFLMGRAWAQLNNPDKAMVQYRLALQSDPFFGPAQSAILESLVGAGKTDEAMDLFRQVRSRIPPSGLVTIARLLIMRNMKLPAAERDWLSIENMLDEVAKTDRTSVQIPMIRCDVYLNQDRPDEAERVLAEARKAMPDRPELWSASILLAERLSAERSDWRKVETLLDEAEKVLGNRVEVRLARARYLVLRKGKDAAEDLRKLGQSVEGLSPGERQMLWSGLTNLMLQADDMKTSREMCLRLAKEQPNNLQVRFMLLELALRSGDATGLQDVLKEIQAIEGEGPTWHYGQAALLRLTASGVADPKVNEALEHYLEALKQRPSWTRIYLQLAGIYDLQGKSDLAFEAYRKAIDGGERNPAAIKRLVQYYYQRRDVPEAQKTLKLLEGSALAGSHDIEQMKSVFSIDRGEFEKALVSARSAAEGSQDFRDHVWLGQVLAANAQKETEAKRNAEAAKLNEEAEASLLKACGMAPNVADTWVSLVQFYAVLKRMDKAQATIEEAAKKLDPKDASLALARCFEVIAHGDEARKHYLMALTAAPKDPVVLRAVAEFYWRVSDMERAEDLTRRLLDDSVQTSLGDKQRARRFLAVILTARGGGANLQEALKLVEKNLADDASSSIDLRLKGGLLAALPSRPELQESRRLFERVVAMSRAPDPDDLFILAQLYLKDNDWANFDSRMQNLLATKSDEPRYVAFYLTQLLKRNELLPAETYLATLERLAPNDFVCVNLRAESLVLKKEYAKALQWLKQFIDRDNALPADRPTRLRLVAESLEQLSHRIREPGQKSIAEEYVRNAEMLYGLYVTARPQQEILIVGFLARLGRNDEAIERLNKTWASQKPDNIAASTIEFARSGSVSPADLARVEATLKEALAKFESPTSLTLVLAEIYQKVNRTQEAEKLYREVIKKEPKNRIALNNLAVLLALEGRQLDEALKMVNAAIAEAGREPQMLDSRASVYIAMKRPVDALKDIAEAINDDPQPVRLFHEAQAYYLANKRKDAAKSLQDALDRGLEVGQLHPAERRAFEELKKVIDPRAA